jgi:hypothetical protein
MMQMRILHRDGTQSRYRKILLVKQLMRKIQKHWKVKMDHCKEEITNVIATIVLLTQNEYRMTKWGIISNSHRTFKHLDVQHKGFSFYTSAHLQYAHHTMKVTVGHICPHDELVGHSKCHGVLYNVYLETIPKMQLSPSLKSKILYKWNGLQIPALLYMEENCFLADLLSWSLQK